MTLVTEISMSCKYTNNHIMKVISRKGIIIAAWQQMIIQKDAKFV